MKVQVYAGPTIFGFEQNSAYKGELTDLMQNVVDAFPDMKLLIAPLANAATLLNAVKKPGTSEYNAYVRMAALAGTGGGSEMDAEARSLATKAVQRLDYASYVEEFARLCIQRAEGLDWEPAIRAAIDDAIANGRSTVVFPKNGTLTVYNEVLFRLQNLSLEGNNCTLVPLRDNIAVLHFPKMQDQSKRNLVRNLNINGQNKKVIGMQLDNIVHVVVDKVVITQCGDTGLWLNQAQFNQFYNTTLIQNDIGLYITNGVDSEGGGNSNAFYSPSIISNQVGVLCDRTDDSITEFGSNYFYSVNALSNQMCTFAFYNVVSPNMIYGGCPEYSGQAYAGKSEGFTRKGRWIPRCQTYMNNSWMTFDTVKNNDVWVERAIVLENNSHLQIQNPLGWGGVWRDHVICDDSSSVSLTGSANCLGNFNQVTAVPTSIRLYHSIGMVMKHPTIIYDLTLPNHAKEPNDISFDLFNPGTGGASGYDVDSVMGRVRWLKYTASRTDQNTNRGSGYGDRVWTQGIGRSLTAVAFNIMSDIDTPMEITFGEPRWNVLKLNLKAGVWRRVFLAVKDLPAASANIFLYPAATAGQNVSGTPTIKLSHLQAINTDDSSIIQKVMAGHFNDGGRATFRKDANGVWWKQGLQADGSTTQMKLGYSKD